MASHAPIRWTGAAAAVTAASIISYVNTLNHELVHDDIFAIRDNADVRQSASLTSVFENDFWGKSMSSNTSHKSYRPMTILTFRLNHQLHGIEPFGYHLTNVCLHALVCLAYFKFCAKWVWGDVGLALAAALLFAVHPIHVEAVLQKSITGLFPYS